MRLSNKRTRMKKLIIGVLLFAVFAGVVLFLRPPDFLRNLLKSDRRTVAAVVQTYEKPVLERLKTNFAASGLKYKNLQIAILAFKNERLVEVYGRNDKQDSWKKFKDYGFTAFSGAIGPKLKEGDRQIPEGVYKIESLNPNSRYHLSLRVNYPNEFDRAKGKLDGRAKLGGDIMIHGRAVTIGCIPIGDGNIEELFVLAAKGYRTGIPVIIAPTDFRKNVEAPENQEVEWEEELYAGIREELKKYK